jgi:hypothetical protein
MRFALAVLLAGCSNIEPVIGPYHVDKPDMDMEVDSSKPPQPQNDASRDAIDEGSSSSDAADAMTPEEPSGISFHRDIRPLINRAANDPTGKGCAGCHYSTAVNHQGIDLGGFDMATLGALREGGGSTGKRIIVAGKPDESSLIQKLRGIYPYGTRMPKNGPPFWSDADIKIVSDWIAQGAHGADDE